MTDQSGTAEPVPAAHHRGLRGRRDINAVSMITVYLVLLLAIPSSVTIAALGSLGRPSTLWGVIMLAWWMIVRLQTRTVDVRPVRQPVRIAYVALLLIALVSFAAAMMRGQPTDQISPAFTALLRLLSWCGVLFVTLDGIRTLDDLVRLVRRIAIGAGLLAVLGIAQFVTGQPIIGFWGTIPGLTSSAVDVAARGGLARAPGTATHPLEFATALNAALPLVIAAAISHGFRRGHPSGISRWWLPTGLISITALVGVSRSAIIGFVVAVVTMIPAIPRRFRAIVVVVGVTLALVVVATVPGLLTTTLTLFTGASSDPSTQSRTNGLDKAPDFIASSPIIGAGFGTFLPRYYIFDNEWVLITVELGVLGVLAFAGIIGAAIWSAVRARSTSSDPVIRLLAYALGASMVIVGVLFAFFDGLSFPISAGLFVLLAGLCGSVRTVAAAQAASAVRGRAVVVRAEDID